MWFADLPQLAQKAGLDSIRGFQALPSSQAVFLANKAVNVFIAQVQNTWKKENLDSALFPLPMPLQSPCVKDGDAGVALLFPATKKGISL